MLSIENGYFAIKTSQKRWKVDRLTIKTESFIGYQWSLEILGIKVLAGIDFRRKRSTTKTLTNETGRKLA